MYGFTDRVPSKVFNSDFKNLAGSKLTQWPVECDFYDMSKQELDAVHLKSVQGWSSGDDVQTIQGFTFTLSNGMVDSGDFHGASNIQAAVKGTEEKITKEAVEFPADKKIARVRIYEKDQNVAGFFVIHGLEFYDTEGALIGAIWSEASPRSGNVQDIIIGEDEKIVGVVQQKDIGTRALGFICMHTGEGYPEEKHDLRQADECDIADLKIRPADAIVRTKHANKANKLNTWASNHNLLQTKLADGSDTWNKWHSNLNEGWVEIEFQERDRTFNCIGFLKSEGETQTCDIACKIKIKDPNAPSGWKSVKQLIIKKGTGIDHHTLPACTTRAVRFELANKADTKRLTLGQILFFGPKKPDAQGRRDWSY